MDNNVLICSITVFNESTLSLVLECENPTEDNISLLPLCNPKKQVWPSPPNIAPKNSLKIGLGHSNINSGNVASCSTFLPITSPCNLIIFVINSYGIFTV